ncbi:MAG: nicotinate-nucleotide adenylyltransferase [Gemmatimonadaceae bacterium]|nr:nicotinate-nucleotide adenylyltransferase [Gemmatimonadaceae bacterium]
MATRIGVFGGTFDPPHTGHLVLALDAADALQLDRLLFVPAARQPLKQGLPMTAPEHRVAMVRALAAADPRFAVDTSEADRGGLSFTVDTMRGFRAAQPDAEFFLLMGADTAATLPQWREPTALAELVTVAIAGRGEAEMAAPEGFRVVSLPPRRLDLSATEIRARVRDGRSVRGFVPDAVAEYIASAGLYRTTN